ncbi:MAG: DIP1984 family protein [Actinomycetota bacterium]|nr:DIP1984 family protein [Actinomycetota bacterium]
MTTVGEALNRRSDLQKRIAQLEERLRTSVLVQEDEQPPEEPEELLSELDAHCRELQRLIAKINHTNASSRLPTGETVTEALARRDVLALRAAALRTAIRAATDRGLFGRYSRSEIRMVRQIRVSDVLSEVDARAKEQRELDNDLQEHNWTTQLIE